MTALISLKQIGQTSASLNDVVTWDGSAWVAGAISTASTFNDLTDAADYVVGDANKVVKVNSSGDGIDFGLVLGSAASQDESYFALASHSHSIANVTGLQTALDAKVDDGSITTSGLTQNSGTILGRTTASTGAIEEITLGAGLQLSSGQISIAASGWAPVTAVGTGVSQDITLPSTVTADDVIVFVEGVHQSTGFTIVGTTLTTTQPSGFDIIIYNVATLGGSGGVFGATVTKAGTSENLLNVDAGKYLRFTNVATKSLTVQPNATESLTANGEWHIRNVGAGDLTLLEGAGVVINPPFGGTLVISAGMTVTLKRVGTDVFDLLGQTVPA